MSCPPPFMNNPGSTIPSDDNTYSIPSSPANSSSSTSSNLNPSIITVILILSITIIVSTSICLLIRYFSGRCRRSQSITTDDDSYSHVINGVTDNRYSSRRVSPEDQLIDSLPIFTFDNVSGRNASFTGGDCAVCLSKFEPHDQLRLLPICCHAFHAECVNTWLQSNQTCPLCRSPIIVSESDILSKVLASSAAGDNSFRIEIGNVSRRQDLSDSGEVRRSYSIGSFNYVVEDESEVTVRSTHARGFSDSTFSDKDDSSISIAPKPETEPPGPSLAAEVAAGSGRSWLREYVDMVSVSLSSRALSFRSSGRFFTGSSRRSAIDGVGNMDEAARVGEEISELFRWFSGV